MPISNLCNSTAVSDVIGFEEYQWQLLDGVAKIITMFCTEDAIACLVLCGLWIAHYRRGDSRMRLGELGNDGKVVALPASVEKAERGKKIRSGNDCQPYERNVIQEETAQPTCRMDQRLKSFPTPADPSVGRDFQIVRLAKSGHPHDAHKMLRQSSEIGHRPKQGTFASVMHSYAKAGFVAQAMAVVHEMQSAGFKFDVVTYNLIMDAWTRADDAVAAQCWMRRMLAEGVRPNVVSFGIIFRACAAAGLLEDMREWFTRAQQFSFDLNLASLDEAVKAIARNDDVVNAMKWLRIAIDQGVQPKITCFMTVLKAIVNRDDVELAGDLIDMMRVGSVQPDGTIWSQCVVLAARNGHGRKAQQWATDCVSVKCTLSKEARLSLVSTGLQPPELASGGNVASTLQDSSATRGADIVNASGDGVVHEYSDGSESLDEIREAARRAAKGRTFVGTIKDFQTGRFGHIACAATYKLFQKDVFVSRYSNPQQLTKGQRVSFVLQVDEMRCLPVASEVALAPVTAMVDNVRRM